jgi:RNA polymerase sigma factor (TIGR02999 family)
MTTGEPPALDGAFAETYRELRALAQSYLRRSPSTPTLQATALVHEAYLKLAQAPHAFADEAHFVRTAAVAMRHILVDHARARESRKRGGGWQRITLEGLDPAAPYGVDVLVLNDALVRLQQWDAQQAQIVELRCFLGMSVEETAANLRISPTTVKRDWAMARAWLQRELEAR